MIQYKKHISQYKYIQITNLKYKEKYLVNIMWIDDCVCIYTFYEYSDISLISRK